MVREECSLVTVMDQDIPFLLLGYGAIEKCNMLTKHLKIYESEKDVVIKQLITHTTCREQTWTTLVKESSDYSAFSHDLWRMNFLVKVHLASMFYYIVFAFYVLQGCILPNFEINMH